MKNHVPLLMAIATAMIASTPLKSRVHEITTDDIYQILINDNKRVVVEFYNPNCNICKAFHSSGVLQQMANSHPDIAFARVGLDKLPHLHQKNNIRAFPTFIIFNHNKEINRFGGKYDFSPFEKRILRSFSGLE